MSALVHCDGPDCDKTRPANPQARALSTPYWLTVEERPDAEPRDFHNRECLNRWADGGLRQRVEEVAADHFTGPISGTVMDWVALKDLKAALNGEEAR